MKKNCLALSLLLSCGYSFAQSTDKAATPQMVAPVVPGSNTKIVTSPQAVNAPVFEKTPLPQNQKAAPAIFYVDNDMPCDRRTYMSHLKQADPKN